jgi:dUTP pyrophosphatase
MALKKKSENNKLRFYKMRNVPTPTRGTSESAGIDFYIPYDLTANEMSQKQPVKGQVLITADSLTGIITEYTVPPRARILIPSGIKVDLPTGKAGMFVNKSGIASRTGLVMGACLIDNDYMGEVHINLINTSDIPVKLHPGKKAAQMIIIDSNIVDIEEVPTYDDLYKFRDYSSERGEGGFGSTGVDAKPHVESVNVPQNVSETSPVKEAHTEKVPEETKAPVKTKKKQPISFKDAPKLTEEQLMAIEAQVESSFDPNIFKA